MSEKISQELETGMKYMANDLKEKMEGKTNHKIGVKYMITDLEEKMTTYHQILKDGGKNMIDRLKEKIEKKEKIHTDDILYAIRHHDKNVILLLLNNIPPSEYYFNFYLPVVDRSALSYDYIDFLHENKVPLDNSDVLLYCFLTKKLEYVEKFVSLNKNLIDEMITVAACKNSKIFACIEELICKYNIKLDMKLVHIGILPDYVFGKTSDIQSSEELKMKYLIVMNNFVRLQIQQNYDTNELEELTDKELNELELKFDTIRNEHILNVFRCSSTGTLELIAEALDYDINEPLKIVLSKFEHTIHEKIISTCNDVEKRKIMREHNKKIK